MYEELEPMVVTNVAAVVEKPVIAGTCVSIEQILSMLAVGMEPNTIIKVCHLPDDTLLDVAVEQVESLPSDSHLAQLLKQYRQQQRQKVKQILERFKQHCQQQYGQRLVKLVLFGSQARGDFSPGSDIDVLVVLNPLLDWSTDSELATEFVADISIETGELISCIFMDSDHFNQAQEFLLTAIRHDGIVV